MREMSSKERVSGLECGWWELAHNQLQSKPMTEARKCCSINQESFDLRIKFLLFLLFLRDFKKSFSCISFLSMLNNYWGGPLFIHIYCCWIWECFAIRCIEGFQIYTIEADARRDSYDGTQEFTVLARIEAGQRKLVPALLPGQVADFPDEVICGPEAEPALQHTADAEALVLRSQQPPCALQP